MIITAPPTGSKGEGMTQYPQELVEAAQHALTFIENRFSDLSPEKRATVNHLRAALSKLPHAVDGEGANWKYSSATPHFPDNDAIEPDGYEILVHTTSPVLPTVEAAYEWAKATIAAATPSPSSDEVGVKRAPFWRRFWCVLRGGHNYRLVTSEPVIKPIALDDMFWRCKRCSDARES